jgi:hypothetical protein
MEIGKLAIASATRNALAYLRNAKSWNSANSKPHGPGSDEQKASAEAPAVSGLGRGALGRQTGSEFGGRLSALSPLSRPASCVVEPSTTPGWSMALVALALPIPDLVSRQEKLSSIQSTALRDVSSQAADFPINPVCLCATSSWSPPPLASTRDIPATREETGDGASDAQSRERFAAVSPGQKETAAFTPGLGGRGVTELMDRSLSMLPAPARRASSCPTAKQAPSCRGRGAPR